MTSIRTFIDLVENGTRHTSRVSIDESEDVVNAAMAFFRSVLRRAKPMSPSDVYDKARSRGELPPDPPFGMGSPYAMFVDANPAVVSRYRDALRRAVGDRRDQAGEAALRVIDSTPAASLAALDVAFRDEFIPMVRALAVPPRLFHGTSLRALQEILEDDVLLVSMDDYDEEGVFTSGSLAVALRYTAAHESRRKSGAVLELDTEALRRSGHEITPFLYGSGTDGIEYVVRHPDRSEVPVRQHLVVCHVPPSNTKACVAALG